jgi:hypothetical protein
LACIVVFLVSAVGVGLTIDKLDALRTSETTRVTNTLTTIKNCTDAQAGKTANPSITKSLPAECFQGQAS